MPHWQTMVNVFDGWPSLNVGACRHPIAILAQQPTDGYDAAGPELAWQPVLQAMAGIEAVRGTDVIKGGQTSSKLFLTVALWYRAEIRSNMRVRTESGQLLVIQSIENVLEMNVVLILNCIALGAQDV